MTQAGEASPLLHPRLCYPERSATARSRMGLAGYSATPSPSGSAPKTPNANRNVSTQQTSLRGAKATKQSIKDMTCHPERSRRIQSLKEFEENRE